MSRYRLCILLLLSFAVGLAAAEQDGLGVIREQGYLRVCVDPANLPFSSSDQATPGFDVELARLVARQLGVEARWQWHRTASRALRPLREGACDLFMGLPKDERFADSTPWVTVSRPYYLMSHTLVVKADSGIKTWHDLTGKRVAVEAASVADLYLLDKDVQRGIYKDQAEAFRAVVSGEAPAALLWRPVASWLGRGEATLHVVPLADPSLEFPVGAGVRRRDQGLAIAVDAAIGQLVDSGEVQQVLERYGLTAPSHVRSSASTAMPAPEAQKAIEEGHSVYSTVCSRCHGAGGVAGGSGGVPTLRNYAGGQEKFVRIVQTGKQGTAMAPFKNILTMEEILSVYQYLTSLPPQ